MYTYSFEKLEVWHDARALAKMIYEITSVFPSSEKFGLTNQMNRAVVSVVSNIAEGSARKTAADKERFVHISFGSLMELLSQLIIASDFGWVEEKRLKDGRSQIERVGNKLNALAKAMRNR